MIHQPFDVDAWLGPAASTTTDEQREQIVAAESSIRSRYPDDLDQLQERETALSAAVSVILGDEKLERVGADYRDAVARLADHHAALTGAIIATDAPETVIADRAGVTRMTVRKARGKR